VAKRGSTDLSPMRTSASGTVAIVLALQVFGEHRHRRARAHAAQRLGGGDLREAAQVRIVSLY